MDAEVVPTLRRDSRKSKVAGKKVRPLDITVLMGGPSNEREVSLDSGSAVAEGLRRRGHQVTTADINPQDVTALDRQGIDVVFIALHGDFGESGEVQELCERRGLAYVGSGPKASALAMDKVLSKEAFRSVGLATPDWAVLSPQTAAERAEGLARVGLPCVVKPIDGGSSVGVTIARHAAARDAAIQDLLDTPTYVGAMVEGFVAGREMTVGILGEQALPPIEIRTAREFYDYTAKYQDDATQYLLDSGLSPETVLGLQSAAVAAHTVLGCRDFSRVDFILAADGRAWVLEINTIPGFTDHSLLPKAAAAVGIAFDELCERIVEMALKRWKG